jgi:hypothetical protein
MFLNDETVAPALLHLACGLGRFLEPALSPVFFKAHELILRGYNSGMGRMRIKKKDAVIPFRETLAYRMILAGTSLAVFMTALYTLVGALSTNIALAIASGIVGASAAFGVFYNLDHLRDAKIPKRTLNRLKRR